MRLAQELGHWLLAEWNMRLQLRPREAKQIFAAQFDEKRLSWAQERDSRVNTASIKGQ